MKKGIIIAGLLVMAVVVARAQETPRADARETAQHARLYQGRASGELTRRETAALKREQRHIHRVERRAKADGTITGREKVRLERKQNRASRHIRRAKHNRIER